LSRSEFVPINAAGGNIGNLVSALENKMGQGTIQSSLNLFSNFAIASSFLGIGLNLFDYIADTFSIGNDIKGRFYTACITFLPPGVANFFFPNGFIAAIGFAGLVVFIGFFLLPFLMVWKLRSQKAIATYRLSGGKPVILLVIIVSGIAAICHVLAMLDFLPKL
ncbi:MAG: aromatic amino acid transport family protein, partial [Saprospiraceae bacterium]|nr:aromatic amino acid transport family protein [Saprospiraceae bacterium]